MARGELERAVQLFRWVFTLNSGRPQPYLLGRAWRVHRALLRVKKAEAALLAAEGTARLCD